jgi:hypothetical protein
MRQANLTQRSPLSFSQGCKDDPSLLLEADTYVSVMSLFSEDKEHAHWRSEVSTRGRVEAAAFELLAQLCNGSNRGRKAVAAGSDFHHCFDRALEVVSSIVSKPEPQPPSYDNVEESLEKKDSADVSESENGDEGKEEVHAEEETTPDLADEGTVPTKIEIDDEQLVVSAYAFLSATIAIPSARDAVLKDSAFIKASSALVAEDKMPDLQIEAVRVMAQLAPYASVGGELCPDSVGDLLQSSLAMEPSVQEGSVQSIRKSLHVHAAEGIQFVYDSLPESKQKTILIEVVTRYVKVLKSRSISRVALKSNDRANFGELAYHLTTIMLVAMGKDSVEECFNSQLLLSLVSTIQWRYDPKTLIAEDELAYWDASATQSLQIISHLLWREEARLAKAGIKTRSLKENVWMVARPGKAPRKAIDFPSALGLVLKSGEATAKLAAQQIVSCLTKDS